MSGLYGWIGFRRSRYKSGALTRSREPRAHGEERGRSGQWNWGDCDLESDGESQHDDFREIWGLKVSELVDWVSRFRWCHQQNVTMIDCIPRHALYSGSTKDELRRTMMVSSLTELRMVQTWQ
jgi:hypothetical protein